VNSEGCVQLKGLFGAYSLLFFTVGFIVKTGLGKEVPKLFCPTFGGVHQEKKVTKLAEKIVRGVEEFKGYL
jgi:hypothetical protein